MKYSETQKSIIKAKLKKALLAGKDAKNAAIEAGFSPQTAHNATTRIPLVKTCQAEIAQEIDKSGMVNRAYNALDKIVRDDKAKRSDITTASQIILKFIVGDALQVTAKMIQSPDDITEINRLKNKYISDNAILALSDKTLVL